MKLLSSVLIAYATLKSFGVAQDTTTAAPVQTTNSLADILSGLLRNYILPQTVQMHQAPVNLTTVESDVVQPEDTYNGSVITIHNATDGSAIALDTKNIVADPNLAGKNVTDIIVQINSTAVQTTTVAPIVSVAKNIIHLRASTPSLSTTTTTTTTAPSLFRIITTIVPTTTTPPTQFVTLPPTTEAPQENSFDGIIVKNGVTNFCKIFIKELDRHRTQILTPFNMFVTRNFALVPSKEEPEYVHVHAKPRPLYDIYQSGHYKRFLETPEGNVGFIVSP